jgi:hypothetical protein
MIPRCGLVAHFVAHAALGGQRLGHSPDRRYAVGINRPAAEGPARAGAGNNRRVVAIERGDGVAVQKQQGVAEDAAPRDRDSG